VIRTLVFSVTLVCRTVGAVAELVWAALRRVPHRAGGVYDRIPRQWAAALLADAGVTVTTSGMEHVEGLGACVYCANHASFVDVGAVAAVLPGSLRFVGKRELFRIPVFGTGLRLTGQIPVDRTQHEAALGAFASAAAAVQAGLSVVVFVEGTRSPDGRLQAFKKGAFVMAIATQAPCVPVYVAGAWQLLPRGGLMPRPGAVEVRIGRPISTAGLVYEDRDRLRQECWEAMRALAEQENGERVRRSCSPFPVPRLR
jgi:1-acyl-sn-glycerol-3-phosphate acyltransferase